MAFTFVAFSYIIALIIDAFLIFFAIYQVIAFDELRTDCKHPIEQCDSLNPLVLPEYILHVFFNLLFLTSGEWFSLLINVPLIAYHIHRYKTRPVMSEPGLYDATTIMNSDILSKCQREGWIKLGFYLLSFFYYLYGNLVPIYPSQELNQKSCQISFCHIHAVDPCLIDQISSSSLFNLAMAHLFVFNTIVSSNVSVKKKLKKSKGSLGINISGLTILDVICIWFISNDIFTDYNVK